MLAQRDGVGFPAIKDAGDVVMQEAKEGKLKESTKKLLAEINKKCPNHLKRYKEDNQDTNSN